MLRCWGNSEGHGKTMTNPDDEVAGAGAAMPPRWHYILPFLALAPACLIRNGSLASLAIVLLSLAFVRSCRRPTLAMINRGWWKDVLIGTGLGLAAAILFNHLIDPLIGRVLGPIDIGDYASIKGNTGKFLVLLALGFVYGGFFEELMFRGFVIGWGSVLLGRKGVAWLACLSSIAFGVAHSYQNLSGMVSTGLTGLALALVYLANRKRLLVVIVTHGVMDAVGIYELYRGIHG